MDLSPSPSLNPSRKGREGKVEGMTGVEGMTMSGLDVLGTLLFALPAFGTSRCLLPGGPVLCFPFFNPTAFQKLFQNLVGLETRYPVTAHD
jgi:hypothetical protein